MILFNIYHFNINNTKKQQLLLKSPTFPHPFGIDSDDFFLIKLHIRCQQRNPVVIFLVGAQKYDLYRQFLFILVVDLHSCGRNNIAATVVRKMIIQFF